MREVERRHLAGDTNVALAAAIGVDEATVRNDLKRLQELWLERTHADQDANRARALAELEDVRTRALAAAEHDERMERAVLLGEPVPDADGVPQYVYRDAKGSAQFRGNKAAALNVARSAAMDKAKLLGLVVDKVAPTNAAGEDLPLDELMARFSRRQAQQADGESS